MKTTRHSGLVRVTHWLTFISFLALVVSGLEIVVSNPRFYWGETGNVNMKPLFSIPIPASRITVPTGYGYTWPDGNGWSRYLHFEAAWVLVLAGLLYGLASFLNGHFRRDLIPGRGQRTLRAHWERMRQYPLGEWADKDELQSYNVLQRTAYSIVVFVLFPMMIWTGLALSPSFDAAFPLAVNLLGGRQTARTLHFFLTWGLMLFFFLHVTMVALSGFRNRMWGMITGRVAEKSAEKVEEHV